MTPPRVAVVVLNWNGKDDTLACLDSLARVAYEPLDVLVVDNASSDDSETAIRTAFPDLELIQTGRNLGYAGGNNVGIRRALELGADYIWILNNDTVVNPEAIDHLVARMESDPSLGICGSSLLYHDDPQIVQAYGGARYNRWTSRTRYLGQFESYDPEIDATAVELALDMVSGAAAFVRRAFVEEVGLMCEDYFLYFEEIDWATRARGRFGLGVAPKSVVWHKEGKSAGTHREEWKRSELADYYGIRNRFLFTRKHHPLLLPAMYLTLPAAILNRFRRRQWARLPTLLRAAFLGDHKKPMKANSA